MNNIPNYTVICWLLFCSIGCTVSTEPIVYGQDGCHYCKMGIVDQRYGAELVTDKGKIMKFDAIECMINHQQGSKDTFAFMVVNTLDRPAQLRSVDSTYFLISKKLPSPMGMYLTGFSTHKLATQAQEEYGGDIYAWDELYEQFATIKRYLNGE